MGIESALSYFYDSYRAIEVGEELGDLGPKITSQYVLDCGTKFFVPSECFLISTAISLAAAVHEFVVALIHTGFMVYDVISDNDSNIDIDDSLKDFYLPTGACLTMAGLSFIGIALPSVAVKIDKWLIDNNYSLIEKYANRNAGGVQRV